MEVFYFVSRDYEFQEIDKTGARILATVMELEKVSGNGNVYRFSEAKAICKSLEGVKVYYGTDMFGMHDNPLVNKKSKNKPVGIVESAKQFGNKIKAIIRITETKLINMLKRGRQFLFSVGGSAKSAVQKTYSKLTDKIISVLHGAKINHLQMADANTPVGFPSAKIEKILSINETVLLCNSEFCSTELSKTPMRLYRQDEELNLWLQKQHQKKKQKKYVILDVEETIILT